MTQRRQAVSLRPPPEAPRELEGFPSRTVAPEQQLWRVVRKGRGPWWFGNSGNGRFDLPSPHGTCYLAADELSALLEVIGPERMGGGISTLFFDRRRFRRLRLPRPTRLADLTSRRCAGFGITLEIHAVVPYDRTQAWASGFHRAGAGGLLYFVRHDPSGGKGVALFSKAGERKSWRRGRELPISPKILARLRDECGFEIVEVPSLRQLRIVEPTS